MSTKKKNQKQKQVYQSKPEWKKMPPWSNGQVIAVDMRLEKACIAFLIGQKCNNNNFLGQCLDLRMQHPIGPMQMHQQVRVGMYFAPNEDAVLDADIVSACATLGFKAKDVLDTLMRMQDLDGNPVISADDTAIWSALTAPFGAVRIAVYYVINDMYYKD